MTAPLKLISHRLCPYVQRAVIALTEKGVAFERIDIDLANKPDWFLKISPLGKTPVLLVGDTAIFESAVILEYLEETHAEAAAPGRSARSAPSTAAGSSSARPCWATSGASMPPADEATFKAKAAQLAQKFARLEARSRLALVRGRRILVWSMQCSVRCSAISTCSTRSAISAFSQTSQSSRAGARRSRRGLGARGGQRGLSRAAARISSAGGSRGCRNCRQARAAA